MSKKQDAINTIDAASITLTDTELQTLESIVRHWNLAAPADPPTWDAQKALAELARLAVKSMKADYGPDPRKPTYSTPVPPETPAPLDSSAVIE